MTPPADPREALRALVEAIDDPKGAGHGTIACRAIAARPAFAALGKMCVLEVEVVRHLTGACGCRRQWMGGIREGSWPPKHTDAIAAAEAELRAIAEVM
jgi:hypothetical protein